MTLVPRYREALHQSPGSGKRHLLHLARPQVEQVAWKPRQFLQVGEACTAVAHGEPVRCLTNGLPPQDRAGEPTINNQQSTTNYQQRPFGRTSTRRETKSAVRASPTTN
ncbi:MAG: hypothetical protein ACHBN1_26970 [Heteroscytonema crispum UTEX LB 1556]